LRVLIVSWNNNNPPLAIIIYATSVRKLGEPKLQGVKKRSGEREREREEEEREEKKDKGGDEGCKSMYELKKFKNLYNKKIARDIFTQN